MVLRSLVEFYKYCKSSLKGKLFLVASRIFTDLLSNSLKCSPRFSRGYEGMESRIVKQSFFQRLDMVLMNK